MLRGKICFLITNIYMTEGKKKKNISLQRSRTKSWKRRMTRCCCFLPSQKLIKLTLDKGGDVTRA